VPITEITAKSIVRKHKRIESCFVTRYGMNLYRGCLHDCAYCDGRAEGYYVEGEFGRDVAVKVNAVDVLGRELDPKRRRKPLKPSYLLLGGGVGDCYQPPEERYCLARRALMLFHERGWPVHVLTKSTLVQRDMDLITAINRDRRAIVSFSFSTVDDKVAARFEPGVPPPSARLVALSRFRDAGVATGMYLMPVIPFVTDTPPMLEAAVRAARAIGVDFVVFGGMTLKDGRQREHFLRVLRRHYPERLHEYDIVYRGERWGNPVDEYYHSLNQLFSLLARRYRITPRIPPRLYRSILDENDRMVVMLDHIDQLMRQRGNTSPYGFAAHSITHLAVPLSSIRSQIPGIKGVGPRVHKTILEILDTGRSELLSELMNEE
jgi:DNA repair photolyase